VSLCVYGRLYLAKLVGVFDARFVRRFNKRRFTPQITNVSPE
jgi:hypothetical protein